jgi:hypothetical protein
LGWQERKQSIKPLEGEEVNVIGGVDGGGYAKDVVGHREATSQLGAVFDVVHEKRRVVKLRRQRQREAQPTMPHRHKCKKTADTLEAKRHTKTSLAGAMRIRGCILQMSS